MDMHSDVPLRRERREAGARQPGAADEPLDGADVSSSDVRVLSIGDIARVRRWLSAHAPGGSGSKTGALRGHG